MEGVRALTFAKYGAPLEVTTIKLRELKPKQVVIKVYSCSLNPIDYKRRDGATKLVIKDEFPAAICFDAAGTIEKIGSEVKDFAVGDRVCARCRKSGALAEFCLADEDVVAKLPDGISFNDAAALPLAGQTALQSLRRGGLKEGETVFISGGAGGVGHYAVQLAKHVFKASRVVTTCSTSKIEFCKSLGADEVLDYTKADPYSSGPFDLVLDTVGDAVKMGGSKMIKPGRFVISVAAMPEPGAFDRINAPIPFFLRAILNLASIRVKWAASPGVYNYVFLNPNAEDLSNLVTWMSNGTIKSTLDEVFVGLEKGPDAFKKIESGRAKGKVVVEVRPS